jgi:uncharacterized protein (DUF1778 family)
MVVVYGNFPYNQPHQGKPPGETAMTTSSAEAFQQARTARLEARVTDEQKAILQRAAALTGRSLSDFVVASAQDAAMRTIHDHELIRLTADERTEFVKAMLTPPAPSDRLKKAAKAYKQKTGA